VSTDSQEVNVPLSEREQRVLRQMEDALSEQDPKFASQMKRVGVKITTRRRIAVGVTGVLVGLALVLVGVTTSMWVGATGFGLMVAAVAFAVATPQHPADLTSRTRSGR
jgi:hypothetical protein